MNEVIFVQRKKYATSEGMITVIRQLATIYIKYTHSGDFSFFKVSRTFTLKTEYGCQNGGGIKNGHIHRGPPLIGVPAMEQRRRRRRFTSNTQSVDDVRSSPQVRQRELVELGPTLTGHKWHTAFTILSLSL